MARTCFTQLMQFDANGDYIVPVRFYFAVPGAKVFPGPHLYGTDYFLSHVDCDVGPGLYWNDVRVYDKGIPPVGISGQGPPCGPLDWWQNGVPSDAPPLQLDLQGRPLCCGVFNPFSDTLGAAVGLKNTVCQPWHQFGPPARSFRNLTTGVTWTQTASTATNWQGHDPAVTTHTVNITQNLQTCLGFHTTNPITLTIGGGHPLETLTLMSYDPATFHGLWQVSPSAFAYAGNVFRFINPT